MKQLMEGIQYYTQIKNTIIIVLKYGHLKLYIYIITYDHF